MSMKFAALKATSDEQLMDYHDQLAENTSVGINYYLDEIRRREFQRAAETSAELARRAYWLTVASTGLAVVSVIVAVIALFVST